MKYPNLHIIPAPAGDILRKTFNGVTYLPSMRLFQYLEAREMNLAHVYRDDISTRLDDLSCRTVNGCVDKPVKIAHTIYFLADNTQSSFFSTQAMIVDGGATAPLSTE